MFGKLDPMQQPHIIIGDVKEQLAGLTEDAEGILTLDNINIGDRHHHGYWYMPFFCSSEMKVEQIYRHGLWDRDSRIQHVSLHGFKFDHLGIEDHRIKLLISRARFYIKGDWMLLMYDRDTSIHVHRPEPQVFHTPFGDYIARPE